MLLCFYEAYRFSNLIFSHLNLQSLTLPSLNEVHHGLVCSSCVMCQSTLFFFCPTMQWNCHNWHTKWFDSELSWHLSLTTASALNPQVPLHRDLKLQNTVITDCQSDIMLRCTHRATKRCNLIPRLHMNVDDISLFIHSPGSFAWLFLYACLMFLIHWRIWVDEKLYRFMTARCPTVIRLKPRWNVCLLAFFIFPKCCAWMTNKNISLQALKCFCMASSLVC